MNPSKLALQNPATIYILMIMIVTIGVMAYRGLPREASPDVQVPLLIVTIPFPGASPQDVEFLITQKAEVELQNVDRLKDMKSISAEGAASITLEFELGFDVSDARNKVREALDIIKPELPEDAEDPIITEINLSEQPMLLVNLSGAVGLVRLKEVADDLKDDIESIPGILEVRRVGGLEREVRVYVNPEKLRYYNLDLNNVSGTIERENTNLPGGTLELGPTKYLIRVPGEFSDPYEISNLVVSSNNQVPVYMRDLSDVSFGFKELESRSRLNGVESVSLDVVKRSGENLLSIRKRIQDKVDKYQREFAGQITFSILSDQAEFVQKLNADLENNIITGFVLVLGVLLLVMGLRNALFVATAIPLSFLMSMVIMSWMGFTLNFIVLFSLILALGMMVDNAIVVVENIYRHMQTGKPRMESAALGVTEVAIPITTSTITTLVAFAPVIFMPGIMGQFMTFLPQTLIITLSCSLFVALIINPVLCSTLMKVKGNTQFDGDEAALAMRSPVLRFYRRNMRWALRHKGLLLLGTLAAFVLVLVAYGATTLRSRGVEFFPQNEPDFAVINVELPVGSTLDVSNEYVQRVEALTLPYKAHIESVVANVGQRRGFGGSSAGSSTSHQSHVLLNFPDWQNWVMKPSQVMEHLRAGIADIAGAEVNIAKQSHGPPTGPPVNIEIVGNDFDVMKAVSHEIVTRIRGIEGLVDLADDFDVSRAEIRVMIDREKVARLGLRTRDVALAVRTAFNGRKVSEFRQGPDAYDIIVQLDERFRRSPMDLEALFMLTPAGEQVPLSELAAVEMGPALGAIRHIDRDRVITVSGNTSGPPGPVLLGKVRARLADMELPPGISLRYTGENEDLQESQAFLLQSFFVALFLIFLVLVTQFNSVMVPFIILSSVVLSLMGVFLGLMVHDRPFSVLMTGIGAISLAGIVVNNAIVLIDFIRQLRARGVPRDEAVVLAGMVRLRPVLLTAATTVLGLLPVAMGMEINFTRWPIVLFGSESSSFWTPMALAVIYGLSLATILTLVVVPMLYTLSEASSEWLIKMAQRWLFRERPPAPVAGGGSADT